MALSSSPSPQHVNSASSSTRDTLFPNSKPVDQSDLDCLVRQTGQPNPASAAIGIPSTCLCRHGFPQAFAMDPLPKATGRMNSGLLKLTCPLLVRAIDTLEDEGFMEDLNKKLADSNRLQDCAIAAHNSHSSVRQELLDRTDVDAIRNRLGDRGTDAFLKSGVAGASAGAIADAKCLHAWLADYMFRGAISDEGDDRHEMGEAILNMLNDRGVDISGIETCSDSCDPSSRTVPTPPVPRNKQRLKPDKEKARIRRKKESKS